MSIGKFELFKDYGDWYWHLKSPNGHIICQSEGYTKRAGALKGITAIKRIAAKAPVVEL